MKRLGIFFCYDKEKIIDEYVFYLLEDICKNLDDLCIISNFDLSDYEGSLNKFTKDIIFKSNIKLNAIAWKEVMVNHYGFDKLLEFDEIVLFDNSFFGPFYPFKILFNEMSSENIDFWGITEHDESKNSNRLCPYKKPPKYIQTYFLVFKKNLVKSNEFQEYWKHLPDYTNNNELKYKHEVVFTKYFSDLGYIGKSYVQLSDDELKQETMDLLTFDVYDMVVNKRVPIIKKNVFTISRDIQLFYSLMTDISRTMNYLKDNNFYDISLIHKYLLRIMDPNQIVNSLNLIKIIPKNNSFNQFKTDNKVLLIMHVYYLDLWEYDFKYLKNVPEYIDIIITTESDLKKEFFEENVVKYLKNNAKVIKISSRGRDMASLLVASRDIVKNYDYFCFIHDKKPHADNVVTWAKTFRDVLWENNLASENYINAIIQEFDDNSSLGLIVPPRVYHANFFHGYVNNYWGSNYDSLLDLLDQMGVDSPINKEYPSLSLGNCFWARYDALEPVFELYLEYDDFPEEPMPLDGTISHALERSYPYVAASRGYYTEIAMTEENAESDIINLHYMLINTLQNVNSKKRDLWFSSFYRFNNNLNKFFKNK